MINVSKQVTTKVTEPSIDKIWYKFYATADTKVIWDQLWHEVYAKVVDRISPLKIYD